MGKQDVDNLALIALYRENGAVTRTMLDWRHRVIGLYVALLAAVGISTTWLYTNLPSVIGIPCAIGGVVMLVMAQMDKINAGVLSHCYQVGEDIEYHLAGGVHTERPSEGGAVSSAREAVCVFRDGAIHAAFERRRRQRVLTYTRLLRQVYRVSARILIIGAVLLTALVYWKTRIGGLPLCR